MSLLAIDVGTSGCKAAVYSNDGLILKSAAKEYTLETDGYLAELNPEDVWQSVITCIRMIIPYAKKDRVKAIIEGICFELNINLEVIEKVT